MKTGENMLLEFVESRISTALNSLNVVYTARIISTSPLTIQPLALGPDGKKQTPVRDCRRLDLGKDVTLKNGDEVLAVIPASSLEHYSTGKDFKDDPDRKYSIDSSIVLGVLK